MNRAELERRLDAIAGEIAAIKPEVPVEPDDPFEWMRWLDTDALRWVKGVIDRAHVHGIPPTAVEGRNGSPRSRRGPAHARRRVSGERAPMPLLTECMARCPL